MSADQLAQYVEYINTTIDADIMIFVKENNRKRTVQYNNLICKWSGVAVLKGRSRTMISFHMISIIRTKWSGMKIKGFLNGNFLLMNRINYKKDNPVQQFVLQII